jgi:hypothetical protein
MAAVPPVRGLTARDDDLARRARAAYWSRFWLVLSAIVSWLSFLLGPTFEGFLAAALLTGMSIAEFQVYRLFRADDLRAAAIGWWNQCLFAALFVIYGGYHGLFVTISPGLRQAVDTALELRGMDETMMVPSLHDDVRLCYFAIALVGGIGQFGLACFYRSAGK